jgi:ammonium transporter Rh
MTDLKPTATVAATEKKEWHRGWETIFLFSEAVMIVFWCVGVTFETGLRSHTSDPKVLDVENAAAAAYILRYYPMWMDVHVMIFIGFGFLMVFLKTHSWSSIGFNYIIAAWCLQCGVVFTGFWRKVLEYGFKEKINCALLDLIEADFCAAAVLITMGALLGKVTFPQMLLLATFECIFYCLNCVILLELLYVHDIGGGMTIHMFGAYFGLAATYFFQPKKALADVEGRNGGTYNS